MPLQRQGEDAPARRARDRGAADDRRQIAAGRRATASGRAKAVQAHRCRDLTDNPPGALNAAKVAQLKLDREAITRQLQWAAEDLAESRRGQLAAAALKLRREHPLKALWRHCFHNRRQEIAIATEMQRIMSDAPAPGPEERQLMLDLEGERLVGAELGRLPLGWQLLHAVPLDGSAEVIDHLAIGPAGIFALTTSHHPRRRVWVGAAAMSVDGQYTPHLHTCRLEANRATRLLAAQTGWQIPVAPVIVVSGAGRLSIDQQPEDIAALPWTDLVDWLTDQPLLLHPDQVVRAYEAARRCDTWHG